MMRITMDLVRTCKQTTFPQCNLEPDFPEILSTEYFWEFQNKSRDLP